MTRPLYFLFTRKASYIECIISFMDIENQQFLVIFVFMAQIL